MPTDTITVDIKEPETWKRLLEVTAPSEPVDTEIDRLSMMYRERAKIPGFRPGKAPADLIKRRYKKEIEEQALENVLPDIYREAIDQCPEKPITEPVLEDITFIAGERLSFQASFQVIPSIPLETYRGLQLPKTVRTVGRREIENRLQLLRESHAELVKVDRPAKRGDYLIAEYTELDPEDQTHVLRTIPDFSIRLGDGNLPEQLSNELEGIRAGEERTITLYLPSDTEAPQTSDRKVPDSHQHTDNESGPVVLHMRVGEVKEVRLPPLDNELAKDLGAENLRRLRSQLLEDLQEEEHERSEIEFKRRAIVKLIKLNPFDPPPAMVEIQLNRLISHVGGDQAVDNVLSDETALQQYLPVAIYQVKRILLLDRIAEIETIGVTNEELTQRVETLAQERREDPVKLREKMESDGELEALRMEMRREKALNFVLEHAHISVEREK